MEIVYNRKPTSTVNAFRTQQRKHANSTPSKAARYLAFHFSHSVVHLAREIIEREK